MAIRKNIFLSLFRIDLDSPSEFDTHITYAAAINADQLDVALRKYAPQALILKSSQTVLLSGLTSDALPAAILIVEEPDMPVAPEITARPEVTVLHCSAQANLWSSGISGHPYWSKSSVPCVLARA